MNFVPARALLAVVQVVLLLTMQLAESTGVHRCPEHDAGVGAGNPEMAMHMSHAPGPEPRQHSSCHCIGVCCQATLAYGAPAPIALIFSTEPLTSPEAVPVASLRATVRLLPFAIGPPAIA